VSRDSQRSAVYAWERSLDGVRMFHEMLNLEEVAEFVGHVWPKERGRYGRARSKAPTIRRVHMGQTSAISHGNEVSFPRWSRNPWVILHELAHELLPSGEHHGPRFVGCLIGLAARHMGLDRDWLVESALAAGLKVNVGSVGATPRYGWHKRAADALSRLHGLAANDVELAVEMGVGYRAARGAVLSLLRDGVVRRRGRAILLVHKRGSA
jgi:hypothetical protein